MSEVRSKSSTTDKSVIMSAWDAIGSGSGVLLGVFVEVFVGVVVEVFVGVVVGVFVAVFVEVVVAVLLALAVGVLVWVSVAVRVEDGVRVEVAEGVFDAVVLDGVAVAGTVGAAVDAVLVGVSV